MEYVNAVLLLSAFVAQTRFTVISGSTQCGKPAITPVSGRIVGGHEARPGSWPWMAMLVENGKQVCGGSIMNENYILTASHCFEDGSNDPARWRVYVGKHHVTKVDPSQTMYHVQNIIMHENYDNQTLKNDIALLRLVEPIQFTTYVSPVCIPPSRSRVVPVGGVCYSLGWGDTMGTGSRYVLNQVPLPIISQYWCSRQDWYGSEFIHGLTFCAGYYGGMYDACTGDSGGPYVCKVGDTWYQQGVISWGYECAKPRWPGIYTDVSKYGSWIRSNMASSDQTPAIVLG